MENEVKTTLELFEQVKERVGSDEVAIALVQEVGKDLRTAMMRHAGNGLDSHPSESGTAMTPKQGAFLQRLNVKIDESWDRAEASRQIDQALAEEC
ncbi:MAG: hypothetical protein ACF8R7_12155 [Phycisphaerales bacterium JB039]